MIPPLPDPVDGGTARGTHRLRYDDVLQDGTLAVPPLAHALGAVCWPAVTARPEAQALAAEGIVPILVRLVIERGDVPVPATLPLRGEATWHRWTAVDGEGRPERIVLSMWVELTGRPGSTFGGPSGEPDARVARIYGEHAMTRLFAPPGERRVTDLPGGRPAAEGRLRRFAEVGGDPVAELPDATVRFGRVHTDANRHVNSVVYLRWFEDAVAAESPHAEHRRCEVAWCKPFFAGDTARIRRWRTADGGVGGAYVDAAGTERCRIHLS